MATNTVDQPTAAPTRKVAAAGIGGALSIILVYIVEVIVRLSVPDFALPAVVVGAVTTLISFGAGYLVREEA